MAMYFVLKRSPGNEFREGAAFCSQTYNSSLGKRALQSDATNTTHFSAARDSSS